MTKSSGKQDATMRNVRAQHRRDLDIWRMLNHLSKRVEKLEKRFEKREYATK